MPDSLLTAVLGRLRRAAQLIGAGTGLFLGLAAAALAVVFAAWLDLAFELSPTARLVAIGVAIVVGVGCLAVVIARVRQQSAAAQLARRLDRAGETGGQILSGIDLSRDFVMAQTTPAPELCAGLAGYAVNRAAALAAQVPSARVIPWRPLARAAVLAGIVTLCVALVALLLPELARALWLRFSDPLGDHPPNAATTFGIEPANAQVRYGAGLDIFVTTEGKPVEALELVLQAPDAAPSDTRGDTVPMFQEPSGRWRAVLTNVTSDANYFVRARRARSDKHTLEVITIPEIEEVRFRISPPAYARRGVYEGPLPTAGLVGLVGTKVEVFVRSNRPLAVADGQLTSSEGVENLSWKSAEESSEVTGTFSITKNGRLDVTVVDLAGQRSSDSFSAPVVLLPDERPLVRLLEPKAVSFATPRSVLPVVVSAEDDYGVARLQLFRGLNESRYLPVDGAASPPPPPHLQDASALPLAEYDLAPGDEIKLFSRVEDNDPAGAKGAESAVVLVRIISEEELAKMIQTRESLELLTAKYNQVERRLEGLMQQLVDLEKKLEQLPPDSPLVEETKKEMKGLADRMEEDAKEVKKLAAEQLPYALDEELRPYLSKTAEALEKMAQQAKQQSGLMHLTREAALKELKNIRKQLGQERQDLEAEIGPPLERLEAAYPLMEDEARFVDLYERQKELAERLGAYRGREKETDPTAKARMRDLEAEQRRIRDDLAQLLDDIEDHAAKLPDTPEMKELREQSEAFASAVRGSGAAEAMSSTEGHLAEFSGTHAVATAEEARDILRKFISQCEGMGDEASKCLGLGFQPKLSSCLGQTAAQLLDAAGLGQKRGTGKGQGAGGGYSSRRSTLNNVGLYGSNPRSSAAAGRDGSENNKRQATGRMRTGGASGDEEAAGFELGTQPQNAGTSEATVPPQYRSKVGRYFQRIADELGTQEP